MRGIGTPKPIGFPSLFANRLRKTLEAIQEIIRDLRIHNWSISAIRTRPA